MNRKRKASKSKSRNRSRSKGAAGKIRRKSRKDVPQAAEQAEDDGTIPDIQKCFLSYQQIAKYLANLADEYPHRMTVDEIGISLKGNSILMAKITMAGHGQTNNSSSYQDESNKDQDCYCQNHECDSFQCEPDCVANRSIAFVEAGSNGCDWISVSTALYTIDHLVKSDGLQTNVDYFVVPCSNPDSYTASFTPGNTLFNLTFNYPIILGTSDVSRINNQSFNKTIMAWKESYQHKRPESAALIKTIDKFHGRIKLFVSLQEGAGKPKILYPYGGCSDMLPDADMITHIAKSASRNMEKLAFHVGSIYNVSGLTFGTIVDYLASTRGLNFSYVMHINNRLQKPDVNKIEKVAKDVVTTIVAMARCVKRFCDSQVC